MGLAIHNYHDGHNQFPYGRSGGGSKDHSWAVLMLPYIEQDAAFRIWTNTYPNVTQYVGINAFNNTTTPDIITARQLQVRIFYCPSRRSPPQLTDILPPAGVYGSCSDYAASKGDGTTNNGLDSGFFSQTQPSAYSVARVAVRIQDVTDGLSNTFAFGEKHVPLGTFNDLKDGAVFNGGLPEGVFRKASASSPLAFTKTEPYNAQFGSFHTGIVQFVFGDGSVHALSTSVPGSTLALLANRSDGLVIPSYD
jgi:hypothetical protein